MKPERKVCSVCGRPFIDKHIWDTTTEYCCLLCADYAKAKEKGYIPIASLEEILKDAAEHPDQTIPKTKKEIQEAVKMAQKKNDFGAIGATVRQATGATKEHPELSEQEKKERAETLRTQGAKGCKAVRINMAFTPTNYDFICTLSKIKGLPMTKYLNALIDEYRAEHSEIYEAAKDVLEQFRDK